MKLSVGRHYGEAVTNNYATETPFGDCEVTVNYWKNEDIECVTQFLDLSSSVAEKWGFIAWLQSELAIAQALKRDGFEVVTHLDSDAIVWERPANSPASTH